MAKNTKKSSKVKVVASEEITPVIVEETKTDVIEEAEKPELKEVPAEEEISLKVEEVAEKPVVTPVTDEPKVDVAAKPIGSQIPKGVVTNCQRLNVRKDPSISAQVVRILNANTIIPIYEQSAEWCKTKGGYVMAKFIKIIKQR